MSLRENKIISNSYLDGNSTALIKAGTDITVSVGGAGGYTISANDTVRFKTTTNGSGVVTVDLTPYAFANPPVVGLTCQSSSTTQYTGAQYSNLTTTSITIRTFVTQATVVVLLNTNVQPVVAAPNVPVDVILGRV